MLPDKMREELAGKVARHFGNYSERLKKSALELQDGGYAEQEILVILGGAFRAGYDDGYDQGYADGDDNGTDGY